MADDRHLTISSSVRLTADDVLQHTFSPARRGLDPGEVRNFLDQVARELHTAAEREAELRQLLADAEHRAAHPEVDEETLTAVLGQETARVLRAARDAAAEVVLRAEEDTARLRAEAQEQADAVQARTRQRADEHLAQSEAAGTDIRRRAQDEAVAKLEHARSEADALLSQARAECRAMVQEAQELRARVLADLSKRRRLLHSQIDQLRAGRERLAQTIDGVRRAVDEVADDLLHAEDEARAAAEAAARSAATPVEGPDTDVASLWRPRPAVAASLPSETAAVSARTEVAEAGAPSSPAPDSERGPATGSEADRFGWATASRSDAGTEVGPSEAGGPTAGPSEASSAPAVETPEVEVPDWVGAGAGQADVPAPPAPSSEAPASPFRSVAARPVEIVGAVPAGRAVVASEELGPSVERSAEAGPSAAGGSEVAGAAVPRGEATPPAATGFEAADAVEADVGLEAAGAATPTTAPRLPAGEVDELFARIRAGREAGPGTPDRSAAEAAGRGVEDEPAVRLLQEGAKPRPRRRGRPPVAAATAEAEGPVGFPDGEADQDAAAGEPGLTATEGAVAHDTGVHSMGVHDMGVHDTGAHDMGVHDTGAHDAGAHDADAVLLGRRDDLLRPVIANLARRLKRCLQDDQNDVLDRLRSRSGKGQARPLLPDEDEHLGRYALVARAQLEDAARAGVVFATGDGGSIKPDAAAVDEMAGELATTLVTALRRRLQDSGGADPADDQQAAERIGAAFREWKGSRVEALAADHAVGAFSRAALAATPAGRSLRWVVDDESGACADCDDNALAGEVVADEEFPTGHHHPPAHAGCRCLLVAASP